MVSKIEPSKAYYYLFTLDMGSYRDLEIYNLSFQLSVQVHEMTSALPSYEFTELGRQIRRSTKSIPTNIAEGYGRKEYKADFIKHLVYAHASCDETVAHLQMISAVHFKDNPLTQLITDYEMLGRKIYAFLKYVKSL